MGLIKELFELLPEDDSGNDPGTTRSLQEQGYYEGYMNLRAKNKALLQASERLVLFYRAYLCNVQAQEEELWAALDIFEKSLSEQLVYPLKKDKKP